MKFKLAMSLKELKKRTSKRYYKSIKLLAPESREVKILSKDDLLTLMHLTRAAAQFDIVHFKLENHHNLEFLDYLNNEIKNGNQKAELTKRLFLSQKSMFSFDNLGEKTRLVKNLDEPIGMGYYPEDLGPKEFHDILLNMLSDGKNDEVQRILSQRTIVVRDKDFLRAIDYVNAFHDEFKIAANKLRQAAKTSSDKKFNKFLELQALALETADERLDAEADKAWAKLKGKFEFTICRESYNDRLTQTIFSNDKLVQALKENNIEVSTKDSIGARVGIINKSGTKLLSKLQNLTYVEAKFMPYNDEYESSFLSENQNQTAVDVDLVTLTGEEGAYQAGIVLAQNLPNDDKLAVKLGYGRRNVYHRQIRKNVNRKLYKNLITEEQFKYFNPEAEHWSTICHENTHSLGPKSSSLGGYSSIIEEFKADMGMYAFLDEFVKEKFFTDEQTKQMMVTSLSYSFLKGKPDVNQAHRTRSLMICNRMLAENAIEITEDVRLKFNFDKVKFAAKNMMAEVIRLQLEGNINNASEYVTEWSKWTDNIDKVANKIKKFSKSLNGYLIQPLADSMLREDYDEKL